MQATQTVETRLMTSLHLNGDELRHLVSLALTGDATGNFLPITKGWRGPSSPDWQVGQNGWLAEWYLQWCDAHAKAVQVFQSRVPQAGVIPYEPTDPRPVIECVATPDQLRTLVRLTALESTISAEARFCVGPTGEVELHDVLARLEKVIAVGELLDAEPRTGYHVATDTEVNESGLRRFCGQSRQEGLAQILSAWTRHLATGGDGSIIPLADPEGRVFALVLSGGEAAIMVDALNSWS